MLERSGKNHVTELVLRRMMHTPKLKVHYIFSEPTEVHTHGYQFAHDQNGRVMTTDRKVCIELNMSPAQLGWLTVRPVVSDSEQRRRLHAICRMEPSPMLLPIGDQYSAANGEPQHKSGGADEGIQLSSGGADRPAAEDTIHMHDLLQAAADDAIHMHNLLSKWITPLPSQRMWPSVQNFVNGLTDSYPFLLNFKASAIDSMTVNSHDTIAQLQQRCSAKYMEGGPCHILFSGRRLDMESPPACGHPWCPAGFACLPSIGLSNESTVHVMPHIVRLPGVTNGVTMVHVGDSDDEEEYDFDCSSSNDSDSSCTRDAKRRKVSAI
jgi:hypothetical protein